jgi:hypothetical protein
MPATILLTTVGPIGDASQKHLIAVTRHCQEIACPR